MFIIGIWWLTEFNVISVFFEEMFLPFLKDFGEGVLIEYSDFSVAGNV